MLGDKSVLKINPWLYLVVAVVVVMSINLSSCSKGPENAIRDLGEKNIPYNNEAFVESAGRDDLEVLKLFLEAGMDGYISKPINSFLMEFFIVYRK